VNNSIIITSSSASNGGKSFTIAAGCADDIGHAQRQADELGGEEKVLACIEMDINDAGVRGLATLLELAVNAHPASSIGTVPVPAEELLLEIFKAGVEYGLRTADPFKYGLAPDTDPTD